jgi:ATP-binding cassette subfamily B protein
MLKFGKVNKPPNMQNPYNLSQSNNSKISFEESLATILPLFVGETRNLIIIVITVIINIGTGVITPYIITRAIDGPIANKDIATLAWMSLGLVLLFIISALAAYGQARIMGYVSQRVLFRLRAKVFESLQSLPIDFFNRNKAGDLISRINNDTNKINQFLSEGVLRFTSLFFSLIGIAGMMLYLNWQLASIVFILTAIILIITRIATPFIEGVNKVGLENQGSLSSEVQEGLLNFNAIVAFQIQNYYQINFNKISEAVYKSKIQTNILNDNIAPLYTFVANLSQIILLAVGVNFILSGSITIGLLIGFLAYAQKFFEPLRILGSIVGSLQGALAAWTRVQEIISLENNLILEEDKSGIKSVKSKHIVEFENVNFGYDEKAIIKNMSFVLEKGKTYALVGPTGGGKSTTASLMARLYDPQQGIVKLYNKDIRTYNSKARTKIIGFILQEPFLFTGTIADNIKYGNPDLENKTNQELINILKENNLLDLIASFENGIATNIENNSISIGQKQLISFIRVILRQPELLILDEATANIDTVTEQYLQDIINQLPETTTKVIIAHRLNTIKQADNIFFISQGNLTPAEDFQHAIDLIKTKDGES